MILSSGVRQLLDELGDGPEKFVEQLKPKIGGALLRPIPIELQEKKIAFTSSELHYQFSVPAKDAPLTEAPEDLGLDPEEILYWREEWAHGATFFTYQGYE